MATALVTGGTSGIGAEFARQLAASGYDLVLVARNPDRLASAAERLHADSGINVETISADLSDRADVARVAARIEDAEHPIDLLVNNAGEGFRTALASADVAAHEHAFDVMCRAVLVLGGAAARSMSGRRGTIINISSLQTYLATGAYAANKAWVTAYSQSLAVELRGTEIGVTVVLPGWVRTEAAMLSLANMSQRTGRSAEDLLAEIVGAQVLPGLLEPEDLAAPYLWLASDGAKDMTGQALMLDRGEVMA